MKCISKFATIGLMMMLMVGLFAFPAFAQVGTEAHKQLNNVSQQISYVPKFAALIAYVIGTFFSVRALFALKGFIQDPEDNPLNRFLGFAIVGSLLLIIPYVITVSGNTIIPGTIGTLKSSATSFNPEAANGCFSNKTIGDTFCNLALQFSPFAALLSIISYVMAAVLALMGFMNLKEYGDDPSSVPVRSIIMKFVLAVMLISLPLAMQTFITTVTGEESSEDSAVLKKPQPYKGSIKG